MESRIPNPQSRIALALVVVVLAPVLAGCRSTGPADLRVEFGQGGGFTGMWEGYTLRANGAVLAWSGLPGNTDTTAVGRLTDGQRRTLWRRIREAAFFEDDREEVGNMTAYMEVTADDRTHRVSWIPRVEGVEPVTDPVERLYAQCRTLAREAAE